MTKVAVGWLTLVAVFAVTAWAAKKREPNVELCSVKTVFVAGNSESANKVRSELEKSTWLKLENDESKADAKFNISEQRIQQDVSLGGQAVTVSGEIMRGQKLLWSGSTGGAASFVGASAKAAALQLLRHLVKEAACR